MKNDAEEFRGSISMSSQNNGVFPSSLRAVSGYLKVVSSGASNVASSVRSSVASSVLDRSHSQYREPKVQWAGFDKLEFEEGTVRRVLLLGYRSGFQVWDVEEANDVHELVSRHDAAVSFMQMQQRPLVLQASLDKFADVRPLLIVAGDDVRSSNGYLHDGYESACKGFISHSNDLENGDFMPTVAMFFSLRCNSYVHVLKFRTAICAIRCSARIVAISQVTQIHCLNAATLEKEYTLLTNPVVSGARVGYGPLALGSRWLAYSGNPTSTSNTGHVSPQDLTHSPLYSTTARGNLVARYAKESSKQLAAGIVTIGDMGYKKFSRYCSELLPDRNSSQNSQSSSWKTNCTINEQFPDEENIGMVIVKDIISKNIVTQFKAHRLPVSALCFDPSGTLLVTASVQGHNINVYRIIFTPNRVSSDLDSEGSYIHLYRLQRGLTNAVIQDICFSDNSQWIMISSSRGTGHLFSLSMPGGNLPMHGLSSLNNSSVPWPCKFGSSKLKKQSPVTLSAVARIKNGKNSWFENVSGASVSATSRISATAAVFLHDTSKCVSPAFGPTRSQQHLLVFSSSGSIIQYALRGSSGLDVGSDSHGLGYTAYEPAEMISRMLITEAVQKWDICQGKNGKEQGDSFDIYGEKGFSDNSKPFIKGSRRCSSVHPDANEITHLKQKREERHRFYISEAEFYMHSKRHPLWSKSEIYFQKLVIDDSIFLDDKKNGEIEVEKIPTRMVEARSNDLVPVFDGVQTTKDEPLRASDFLI